MPCAQGERGCTCAVQLREALADAMLSPSLPTHKRQLCKCCRPPPHHSQLCKRHGRLVAESDAHAANIRSRDQLIRDTAERLGVPLHAGGGGGGAGGAAPPLPPSAVEAFVAELGARLADLQRQMSDLKTSHR